MSGSLPALSVIASMLGFSLLAAGFYGLLWRAARTLDPTARVLARAVPLMCRFAGISEDARARAVEQMGEQQAAVAVAVTLEKYDRQEVNSPGGYLRAMTDRAAAGELHLARSVFGLAARNSMEIRH